MTVAADDARLEIETAIRNANESAKRMHDSPAYYERIHLKINDWLDELELAEA